MCGLRDTATLVYDFVEAAQAKLLWILAFLVNDARVWLRLLER